MKLQAKVLTDFLQTPAGPKIGVLFPDQEVAATGKTQGLFTEIDPGGVVGWSLTADLEPSDHDRLQLDQEVFVEECIVVERSFNNLSVTIPWFIAADFLVARAIIETGLINSGPKTAGSDAVGPLQVSSDEWKSFLNDAGTKDLSAPFQPFNPSHFDHYLKQIWGAGYRTFADAKAISAAKLAQQPPVGTASNPFLPSYLDVFHAYLTSPAAAVAILDANKDAAGQARTLDQVLTPPALTAAQLATLFSTRGQFAGTAAAPKTVAQFVAATEAALNSALTKAFELIKQFAPGELPQGGGAPGSAPWLSVAKDAEVRHVAEATNAAEIKNYFLATNHGPVGPGPIPAWCGAFVAHCMAESDNTTAAASIPKDAALAVSWRSWGKALAINGKDIPEGAVVVLSPAPGTDTTGHVAFFSKFVDAATIELLGGNQHNAVNFSHFKASSIVDVRWLAVAPTPEGGGSSVLEQLATSDDILTLARTIFGEARGEPNAGREAVAHVVINRVNSHRFKDTVQGVCLQPRQFSCFNVGDPNRPIILAQDLASGDPVFKECIATAQRVSEGAVADNTGGATHYYAKTIAAPSWTIGATFTVEIGVHRFYKNVT
jgi:uncharacterized protein (TIGR02594 family)